MSPPFDSVDVVLGSILTRMDKSENDINELHSKQREAATRTDQLTLYADDFKWRIRNLENHHQTIFDSHYGVVAKVEMMEDKLDELKSNLTKVIEGQMQIISSNAATLEKFQAVLATQGTQHTARMKILGRVLYIGGPVLFLLVNAWAVYTGQQTMIKSVFKFLSCGIAP